MKKIIFSIIILMGVVIWYYFLTEKQEISIKKSVEVVSIPNIKTTQKKIIIKDINKTVENKKPTVTIHGFNIASIGERAEIVADAKDEDGNITKYEWKLDGKFISNKPKLSFLFSEEREYIFTLDVTDNLGAKAKDSISIDVYPQADKRVFYKHRDYDWKRIYYIYYNSDGNVTKRISQDRENITIKEYQYNSSGSIIKNHIKNYIKDGRIQSDITNIYDEFGNGIESFGETNYDIDKSNPISIHEISIYNKDNRLIKKVNKENNQISDIYRNSYYENGELKESRVEEYKDGVLDNISVEENIYDENGNYIKNINSIIDIETENKNVYFKEMSYNEDGYMLSKELYKNDGEVYDSETYEYDSENRVIKKIFDDGIISYVYNDEGYIIRKENKYINFDNLSSVELLKYNEDGQVVEVKKDNDIDGYFEEIVTKEYDENGIQSLYRREIDGELKHYSLYQNGNLQETGRTSGYIKKNIYNDEGKIITALTNYGGIKTRTDYIYNSNGELIKEIDENGNILYSMELKEEK